MVLVVVVGMVAKVGVVISMGPMLMVALHMVMLNCHVSLEAVVVMKTYLFQLLVGVS